MTITNQQKLAKHILRLLKVNDIIIPIGRTSKGNFGIKYSSQGDDFEMYLDAIPLSTKNVLEDENNIELKKMIEKYFFDAGTALPAYTPRPAPAELPKRGRPLGAKNKQHGNDSPKKSG